MNKGEKKLVNSKEGNFSNHGTPNTIMSFLVKHPDVIFTPQTLSLSLGRQLNTIRINVRFLIKFNCLKVYYPEMKPYESALFSVTCDEFEKFKNLIVD